MAFVGSFCWAALTAAMCLLALRWMPEFEKRAAEYDAEEGSVPEAEIKPFDKRLIAVPVIAAAVCGFISYPSEGARFAYIGLGAACAVLSCAMLIDARVRLLPNRCSLILLISGLVLAVCEAAVSGKWGGIAVSLAEGAVFFAALFVMARIVRGGLGMGDVKLMASSAFICGRFLALGTLLFALVSCAAVSVVLLVMKRKNMRDTLPFGPFIFAGFAISVLLGVY